MLEDLFIVALILGALICIVRKLSYRGIRTRAEPEPPIADQIERIREAAIFMNAQLHARIDRFPDEETSNWAKAMIGFYARLEALASSCSPTEEDAHQLARDASKYIEDHSLKGFFIFEEASRLATLLHRRKPSL